MKKYLVAWKYIIKGLTRDWNKVGHNYVEYDNEADARMQCSFLAHDSNVIEYYLTEIITYIPFNGH